MPSKDDDRLTPVHDQAIARVMYLIDEISIQADAHAAAGWLDAEQRERDLIRLYQEDLKALWARRAVTSGL